MRRYRALSAMQKLKALYRSEINVEISSFFDEGWHWKLGDSLNGFKAECHFISNDFEMAVGELWRTAKEHYPNAECFK